MSKVRSPNYPAISLAEAVPKIQSVYEREHRHPASREIIAKALGYGGLNGSSLGAISALLKYGLLEAVEADLKVSERAENIALLKKGHPDRVSALREAAFAPALFAELHDSFGDKLPSDENLRFSLVKKGFNPKAVDGVIRAYRDTLEFVNAEGVLIPASQDGDKKPSEAATQYEEPMQSRPLDRDANLRPLANTNGSHASEQDSFGQTLIYRIAEDCKARVQFEGVVTHEAIKKLIAFLELGADVYPSKLEKRATDSHSKQLVEEHEDLWESSDVQR